MEFRRGAAVPSSNEKGALILVRYILLMEIIFLLWACECEGQDRDEITSVFAYGNMHDVWEGCMYAFLAVIQAKKDNTRA